MMARKILAALTQARGMLARLETARPGENLPLLRSLIGRELDAIEASVVGLEALPRQRTGLWKRLADLAGQDLPREPGVTLIIGTLSIGIDGLIGFSPSHSGRTGVARTLKGALAPFLRERKEEN